MYSYFPENFEYDDCTAKGICSVAPSLAAIQEVLLIIIKQTSYYIMKLKTFSVDTHDYDLKLITLFANTISSTSYSDSQLIWPIAEAYGIFLSTRNLYSNICKEKNINKIEPKNLLFLSSDMNLSKIIFIGEKSFQDKYRTIKAEKKNYQDLMILILKSFASNIIKLVEYNNINNEEYIQEILTSFNILFKHNTSIARLSKQIDLITKLNIESIDKLNIYQKNLFGNTNKYNVSYSTNKGKAILVSGTSLLDLERLLNYTKDKNIDIYTHDELLTAHAYDKFRTYKNLKGHFGICQENCVLDFATFPGAILLTKNSNINTEYLYRGRLFTTAKYRPNGVIAIKDNNMSKLVESAIEAKGFAKENQRASDVVGYKKTDLIELFGNIYNKLYNGEIKKVIILGLAGISQNYYQSLLKILPKDIFVLSFSYDSPSRKNFYRINVGTNRQLVNEVLNELFKVVPVDSNKLVLFFSKCDSTSIAHIVYLKSLGAKNIFITNCSPKILSPVMQNFLVNNYKIRKTTKPELDINILK